MKNFLLRMQFLIPGFLAAAAMMTNGTVKGEENDTDSKAAKAVINSEVKMPVEALFSKIEELAQSEPEEDSEKAYVEHLKGIAPQMESLASQILSQAKGEKIAIRATRIKFQMLQLQTQLGDAKAVARTKEFIDQLQNDKRPSIAREGFIQGLVYRAGQLPKLEQKAQVALIGDVKSFIENENASVTSAQLSKQIAEAYESIGKEKLAGQAYVSFGSALAKSKNPSILGLADMMLGSGRRLSLPGNELRLVGKTVDKQDFEWEAYKDKVVLVVYWASWCGPCMAEIPRQKMLFEKYNDQGFEIVGVNLDDTRGPAQNVITKKALDWISIFDSGITDSADPATSNANYYGVNGIPTMFLVGRDGKVISTTTQGKALEELVAKVMKAPAGGK